MSAGGWFLLYIEYAQLSAEINKVVYLQEDIKKRGYILPAQGRIGEEKGGFYAGNRHKMAELKKTCKKMKKRVDRGRILRYS